MLYLFNCGHITQILNTLDRVINYIYSFLILFRFCPRSHKSRFESVVIRLHQNSTVIFVFLCRGKQSSAKPICHVSFTKCNRNIACVYCVKKRRKISPIMDKNCRLIHRDMNDFQAVSYSNPVGGHCTLHLSTATSWR